METQPKHVAIIGAGMAGLSCATHLAEQGIRVTVFDKGRGPGGRMAARRAEIAGETVSFDHGAPSFSAHDEAFSKAVSQWHQIGVVAPWSARGNGEWVGVPGMNGPLRAMAEPLGVRWGERIERLERTDTGWRVGSAQGQLDFTDVAVAIPAEQAAVLLELAAPELAATASAIHSTPCWAVMAGFAQSLPIEPDFIEFAAANAQVSLAARNSAKPQRRGTESWVLHASPVYSQAILEHDADEAAQLILSAFFDQTNLTPAAPLHLVAHRWRYCLPVIAEPGAQHLAHWNAAKRIGIAGDYLAAPNVEGAWRSGRALAHRILR